MARHNEKSIRTNRVYGLLTVSYGLRESELANMLGWHRRTVNNYLHELEVVDKVYKDGRLWCSD